MLKLVLLSCLLALGIAAPAQAASTLSLSASPDPTEDEPVTIAIAGNSDTAKVLTTFREFAASDCAATASQQYARSGSYYIGTFGGTSVGPGAITRTAQFVPTEAGTYRICAYLSETANATPIATATTSFDVRLPTGSLAVSGSPDPTEDELVTMTVTGTSEANRTLTTFREFAASDCAATASQQYARSGSYYIGTFGGTSVGPGAITRTAQFVPTEAGTYRICAYLSETANATPIATATTSFDVRLPTGSLALAASGTPTEDQPLSVTATGQSEASRTLYVFSEHGGSDCGPTAAAQYARPGAGYVGTFGGTRVGPGAISRAASFTPREGGTWRLCAFLAERADAAPLATATLAVAVPNDPSDDPPAPVGARATWPSSSESTAASRAPLPSAPPVELLGPPADLRQADRRPMFSWVGAAGFDDNLVVTDAGGHFMFAIDKDATYGPSDEDSRPADDEDAYVDDEEFRPAKSPSEKTTLENYSLTKVGPARWVEAGGKRYVRLAASLPPGRYRWYVERTATATKAIKSESRPFALLGPSLTRLIVKARASRGRTTRNPGQTAMRITTTPFADVRIRVSRGGRTQVLNYDWGSEPSGVVNFRWTCRSRGAAAYRFSVVAMDAAGKRITRRGSFKTVSRSSCRAMLAREKAAARRRELAAQRRAAAERRREAAAERAEYRRLLRNCTALGGVLRELSNQDGSFTLRCLGPYGNFLPFNP